MKKFISILLSVLMIVSLVPSYAFADETDVSSNEASITFDELDSDTQPNTDADLTLDFTAYDSAVILVDQIEEEQYTAESIAALRNSVTPKDALTTQAEIDSAVAAITTAYSSLEKKTFDVDFVTIDSQERMVEESSTYSYGDVAELRVHDTDEVVFKWLLSTEDSDTKLEAQGNSISIIVTCDVTITAFTDVDPDGDGTSYRINFLSITGKLCAVSYVQDINDVEMPAAPSVPFYEFDKWEKIDDTTYQAKYTLNFEVCHIIAGANVVLTNGELVTTNNTDSGFDISYGNVVSLESLVVDGYFAFSTDGTIDGIISIIKGDNVVVPELPSVYVIFVITGHVFKATVIAPTCEGVGYTIYMCDCGESYGTSYVRKIGHEFAENEQYCLHGCGAVNQDFTGYQEDEETNTEYSAIEDNSADEEYADGVDEQGYNNKVFMP